MKSQLFELRQFFVNIDSDHQDTRNYRAPSPQIFFFFNFSGPASVQCVIVILCIDFGIVLEFKAMCSSVE